MLQGGCGWTPLRLVRQTCEQPASSGICDFYDSKRENTATRIKNLLLWFLSMVKISLRSSITWETVSAITWSESILALFGKVMMYYDVLLCRFPFQNAWTGPRSILIGRNPIFLFASQMPREVVAKLISITFTSIIKAGLQWLQHVPYCF